MSDAAPARHYDLAKILMDLDRCPHGRHAGDTCAGWVPGNIMSGCVGGKSLGNPFMPAPGERIGTDLYGRPYVMPAGAPTQSTAEPSSWRPR